MEFNSAFKGLKVISVCIHKVLLKTSSRFQFIFSAIHVTECIKFVPCVYSTWRTVSRIL